jgi:hypothetical protein
MVMVMVMHTITQCILQSIIYMGMGAHHHAHTITTIIMEAIMYHDDEHHRGALKRASKWLSKGLQKGLRDDPGPSDPRSHGSQILWIPDPLDPRSHGSQIPWIPDPMRTRSWYPDTLLLVPLHTPQHPHEGDVGTIMESVVPVLSPVLSMPVCLQACTSTTMNGDAMYYALHALARSLLLYCYHSLSSPSYAMGMRRASTLRASPRATILRMSTKSITLRAGTLYPLHATQRG